MINLKTRAGKKNSLKVSLNYQLNITPLSKLAANTKEGSATHRTQIP